MTVTCVVQARMGSTRLPGKVVADLHGRPMLRFMLDRLAAKPFEDLPFDHLVVATSDLDRDDVVADVAAGAGVPVVRGSEADVLARFMTALDTFPADHVVRLTADCPLADPAVVGAVIRRHLDREADYTSNVFPRTFPQGLDVEVARAEALRTAADEATERAEREHVTPFLYRNPQRFRLANLRAPELLGDESWTVDTPDDLEFVRKAVAVVDDPRAPWQVVLAAVGRRFVPAPGALHLRPVLESDGELLLAWRNDADAVRFSGTGRAVEPDEHRAWFARRFDDPGTQVWIGEVDGVPVGQTRIDVGAAIGEVSIAVAPEARGQGRASGLLEAVQRQVRSRVQVKRLVAQVNRHNTASVRVFERAGFAVAGREGEWDRFEWEVQ